MPDVIFACESKLDGSIPSGSIFPDGYVFERRDRNANGGGVFIGIRDSLVSVDHPELRRDSCELLWQHLEFEKSGKLYLSSFYRPPCAGNNPLTQLQDSIGELQSISPRSHTSFIICGDFNLPDIDWDTTTARIGSPQKALHENFLNILQETGSVNLQTSVTRPSSMNILDLVVTSNPNIITDVQVVPGMSDHDIVLFQINMSPKIQRKPPHRIYKYDLQDIPKIKGHIRSRTDHFLSSDPHTKSVDENWTFFKDTIRDAMAQYIPSKMSKTKQSHPWITSEIKRQMRKRDKLYCKAKKTKLRDIWTKYTHQRNKVTNMMTSSYDNYMANIIGSSLEPGGNQKRFWSFIRSQRKEMSGIPALEAEGEIYSTDRGKAQALNAQFVSVFTQTRLYLPTRQGSIPVPGHT